MWASFEGGASSTATFGSASGDSTWTACPSGANASLNDGGVGPYEVWQSTGCAFILSATGGASTVSVTVDKGSGSLTGFDVDAELLEWHRSTSTATQDDPCTTAGHCSATATCSTACAGPAMTITGTDACAQWISTSENPVSALGGAYTSPADIDSSNVYGAIFGALTVSSCGSVSYNQMSSGIAAMSSFSVK